MLTLKIEKFFNNFEKSSVRNIEMGIQLDCSQEHPETSVKMKVFPKPEALSLQKHDMAPHVKCSSNCYRAKKIKF